MRLVRAIFTTAIVVSAAPLPQPQGNDQLLGTVQLPPQNSGGLVGALGELEAENLPAASGRC
jgi:hypothetical protein